MDARKPSYHVDRIADQLQQALAMVLLKEYDDPELRLVSISGVQVSKDLGHAKIYFSTLGDQNKLKETLMRLQKEAGYLRMQLAKVCHLRVMPELHFFIDESFLYGEKIDQLITQAKLKDQHE